MSRSNPEIRLETPCTRFFEWSGDEGGFKYFDKAREQAEKGTGKVKIPLPFTFIVLDELATITGYSDARGQGFYSNEIRKKDIKEGIFKVRSGKELVCQGTYDEIKGKEAGMKFADSVYIAYMGDDKKLVIGNIKMVGSSLNAWINYVSGEKDEKGKRLSKPNDPYKGAITVATMKEGKKGKTIYQMPVFTPKPLKPETEAMVLDLDRELQDYLTQYFAKKALESVVEEPIVTEAEVEATFTQQEEVKQPSAKEVAMEKQAAKTESQGIVEDDLPW